jgi:hypothetical protein
LKATRECGMITNEKFNIRVKKFLDYKWKIQG